MSILSRTWTTIKSFGLNYDDFPTMLSNVSILLKIITIDIEKKSKPIPLLFYIVTTISLICYFYVYFFSLGWMVFSYYKKSGDWIAISVVLGLGTCSSPCLTKFIYMKLYAKEIKNTIQTFIECDAGITDERFSANLRKYLRVVKQRATIIWGSFSTICVLYLSVPFFRSGKHFHVEFYVLYGLVPMDESPNYEIALLINTVGTAFCVHAMICTALYVIVVIGYIEAQVRALSEELDYLWNDSQQYCEETLSNIRDEGSTGDIKEKLMNEFIEARLSYLVKIHIANIGLLNEVDRSIRATLAVECGIIGFSITAELLGGLEYTFLQIPYSMVQLFMDCVGGQRLIDACDIFEFAIYSCKWQNFNVKNQKKILLLLTMSQKTLVLTAGGLLHLNFVCLMSMLKSTYSVYTTLNSMIR